MRSSAAHPLHEREELYFEIGTADGAVGVRGTSVWVKKDNNGTQALAIDSGKLTDAEISANTGSAMTISGTGTYSIRRESVPLRRLTTVTPNTGISIANTTPTKASIYNTTAYNHIRLATIRDIADYRALERGVGNLRTISMTNAWLRTNDIYSWSVVASAQGIEPTRDFVVTEFARTEPTDEAEKTNLCRKIAESSDGDPVLTASSIANKYWIDSPNLCQSDRILWEADYRRGDTNIYGDFGATFKNASLLRAEYVREAGLKVETNGQHISYNLSDLWGANALKGKKIVIELENAFQDGDTKYLLDMGGAYQYMWEDIQWWTCPNKTWNNCLGSGPDQIELTNNNKTVTIHLPQTFNPARPPDKFIIGATNIAGTTILVSPIKNGSV